MTAAEVLEDRVLLAVTLLIDYSLDNGFFTAERRAAIESVASEIGSRLNDTLAAVPFGSYNVTDPKTFTATTRAFDSPANTLRIFVAGSSLGGGVVGQGGWRTSTGIRNFDRATDFQPYVGYVGFDNDGSTTWNFSDGIGLGTNFQSVARHELLHVLGLGGAATWDALISNNFFTGAQTRAANGGINPAVDASWGHFAVGVNSIMAPVITTAITRPTAIDWAALDDIGWDVSAPATPGVFADVLARTSSGAWMISTNGGAGGLSSPTGIGQWNEAANWRDVLAGDFDGNGLADVVGRTSGGAWWASLNTGGQFVNRFFGGWNPNAGWHDVKVADFDGDGRDDVLGRTVYGEWYLARSTGTGFVTTWWAAWSEAANWQDVRVGDFTGDGRADVAARTQFGEWWIGRSTGTGFASAQWTVWNAAAGWRDVVVADFDGNGRDDIAARTMYGEWYVALSLGTHFANGRWTGWNEAAGWRDVRVGDFYGDARPDIIARTATGAWYVATSLGSSFGTYYYGYGIESLGDLMAGQFAGNAKADLLGRTTAGTWFIGENSGSQIVFRPFGQWNEGLGWRGVAASRSFVVAAGTASAPLSATLEQTATSEPASVIFEDSSEPLAALGSSTIENEAGAWMLIPETLGPASPPPSAAPREIEALEERDDRLKSVGLPLPLTLGKLWDSLYEGTDLLDALTA